MGDRCTCSPTAAPPPFSVWRQWTAAAQGEQAPTATTGGVFVCGRMEGFELVGEKGSKCPNLMCASWGSACVCGGGGGRGPVPSTARRLSSRARAT